MAHAFWLLLAPGLGALACAPVPLMPSRFSFRREMFSFWATESMVSAPAGGEEDYFGKIEQRPAFMGGHSSLYLAGVPGLVGTSSQVWPCFPWQYCNFKVFDCTGQLMYQGDVIDVDSTSQPGKKAQVYKLLHGDLSVLGKTSALPSLLPRMGGINAPSESLLRVHDTGDVTVMDLSKDANQLVVTHWHGVVTAPGMEGYKGAASSVPLADPRLIAFLISNQFRNKGVFGPVINFLLVLCAAAALAYLIFKCRRGDFQGREDEDAYDLRELKDFVSVSDGSPLLEGGCCAGNRPKY